MIYLFDKDEKLIKIVRKSAVKTALQKYALTTERYVSDRLTVELKGLNADELEQVEYMAIQTMEDAHTFHYFYVAQKSSDELTTLIGVQSGIEELRKSPVFDKRPKNALARDVITDLLAGTNWQARFVGETTPHNTNFYYTSIFDALKKVCEVWDLEMQFFVEMNGNRIGARYINFKRRIGEAVGKRVVYGHNALQILQEVERTNIFTALVGRGKGEETGDGYGRKITFEDVVWSRTQGKPVDKPKGQKYLELPLMTRQYGIKNADGSMRPKIGFVDFSEEENPEVLIERTYRALIDAARPQLTLKTSSVYLKGVKVGDTIRVVRHDKKLDYDTRIFEITFNRLNDQSSDIKLGDRIGESNEAKVQTIADKAVEQFVNNEFSNFVQNLPDYLPSADGFNNNWYGAEDPTVKYPGKVLINDIWYKPDPEHEGHKIMLRWTGEVWEEILRTYESESLRDRIAEEIAQVNQSMQAQSEEHDRQVADILSKTQSIESLANQAKSDAASALARANQVKTEAIADARAQVATVSQALNTAKTDLQNQVNVVDAKAVKLQSDANALRTDLNQQAQTILDQAQAQTALTNRVATVETLADGTRSTVAELSKTVSKATGDIASVASRTKTVEDTLSQTRTQYEALSQTVNAQTGQIDSINRKTADLQSGIDGVTERFENLRVGGTNLFKNSDFSQGKKNWHKLPEIHNEATGKYVRLPAHLWTMAQFVEVEQGEDYVISLYAKKISESSSSPRLNIKFDSLHNEDTDYVEITKTAWKRFVFKFRAKKSGKELVYFLNRNGIEVDIKNIKMEKGLLATDYSPSYEDLRSEIATYKRTAEESSAELSRQIQLADGKAVEAKTYAQQTADAIKTRLESLETYKNEEGTRASQYLSASRTETAKQLSAERAVIATNYVAKSTYDENVRGTTLKLNEIKTTADTAKQNLATYQNTVDRKLEELTSSTQTIDGKINTASAKVDTVAGQIRTEISEVEGKIPITAGTRNLLKGTKELTNIYSPLNVTNEYYQGFKIARTAPSAATYIDTYRASTTIVPDATEYIISFYAKSSINGTPINNHFYAPNTTTRSESNTGYVGKGTDGLATINLTTTWQRYWIKWTQTPSNAKKNVIIGRNFSANNATVEIAGVALYEGSLNKDWSPAPEDYDDELSSVKTTITQTASGVEQLSTSLTTTNNKVSTAETKIRQLISDVSSKVSQTDYNTLTGRVDSAETAITQNADEINKRLTKTQVDKAITDKGYQTKAQVDSNISGRGYITSSALQPYALATAVQSLVKETADSFSRTISETKALIPTSVGGRNLLLNSSDFVGWSKHDSRATITDSGYNNNKAVVTADASNSGYYANNTKYIPLELNTNYITSCWVFVRKRPTSCYIGFNKVRTSNLNDVPLNKWVRVSNVFNTGASTSAYTSNGVFYLIASGGDVLFSAPKLETGTIPTDYTPAPEDLATVTALHDVKDTVSSHTRTIGAVGTAGSILDNISKVTQTAAGLVQEVSGANGLKTQVSTLAGSYAIKNLTKAGDVLGQINLNKDGSIKIDGSLVQITGKTYIQDGVITSAKIGKGQIGTAHIGEIDAGIAKIINLDVSNIKGLDAEFIKAKIENAFIGWMKGKTITAQNEAMTIGLNDAFIRFKDNAKIEFQSEDNTLYRTKNGTSAFIHFRDDSYNGVYTAMGVNADNTGTQNDYSSGSFAGVRVIRSNPSRYSGTTVDQVQLVGDEIRIRHGYGYENDYLVIKWDNQGKIDLIKFLRSVASKLGLPLT
ncbi:TPA: phage tail protein [Streptococcus suis]|nr:phage tail protein [Streptococcus suis]